MRTIVSKIEELDIEKKVNEITQLLNNKCEEIKKENQDEIKRVKAELEQNIIEDQNKKGMPLYNAVYRQRYKRNQSFIIMGMPKPASN